jgi:glycopeptide antibiotics resistance protein
MSVVTKKWFCPILLALVLILLALLSAKHAAQLYTFFLSPFGADAKWVGSHSKIISNVGHTVGFALFAIVCRFSTFLRLWQVLMIGLVLVVSIELAQAIVPSRSGRLDDVCFGAFGIFVGLVLFAAGRWCLGLIGDGTRDAVRGSRES